MLGILKFEQLLLLKLECVGPTKRRGCEGKRGEASFCLDFFWVLFCVKTKKYQTKSWVLNLIMRTSDFMMRNLCR